MADAYGIPREHNDADTSIVQPVNEIIGNLTLESDVHYSQIEGIFGHQPPRVCLKCTLQRSGDRRRTLRFAPTNRRQDSDDQQLPQSFSYGMCAIAGP